MNKKKIIREEIYIYKNTYIVRTPECVRRNEEKLCAQCTLVELNKLTKALISMFEMRCPLSFVTFFVTYFFFSLLLIPVIP